MLHDVIRQVSLEFNQKADFRHSPIARILHVKLSFTLATNLSDYINIKIKMKTALLLASIVCSASAFAPASQASTKTAASATKADLEAIAQKANPIVKFYDPLNLAEADFYGFGNEATIGWLRHAEIKVRFKQCKKTLINLKTILN